MNLSVPTDLPLDGPNYLLVGNLLTFWSRFYGLKMHSFETIDPGGIASLIIRVITAFGKFNSSNFSVIFPNSSLLYFLFMSNRFGFIDQLLEKMTHFAVDYPNSSHRWVAVTHHYFHKWLINSLFNKIGKNRVFPYQQKI